jgi:hypothetical protein
LTLGIFAAVVRAPNPAPGHPRTKQPWRGGGGGLHLASQGSGEYGQHWDPERRGWSSSSAIAAGVGGDAKESSAKESGMDGCGGENRKDQEPSPRWTSDELPRAELEHHDIFLASSACRSTKLQWTGRWEHPPPRRAFAPSFPLSTAVRRQKGGTRRETWTPSLQVLSVGAHG